MQKLHQDSLPSQNPVLVVRPTVRSRGKVLLNRFNDGGGNHPNPESDTKLQENPGDQSHIVDDHHLNKNEEHDEQQERVSMYNHNFSFPWMYLVNHLKS